MQQTERPHDEEEHHDLDAGICSDGRGTGQVDHAGRVRSGQNQILPHNTSDRGILARQLGLLTENAGENRRGPARSAESSEKDVSARLSANAKPNTVFIKFENEQHPTADAGVGPGMDVVREGEYLYMLQERHLVILSVKDPARPVVIGKLEDVGNLRQIVVRGNVAYITAREDGLFVVDVSDRTAPKLLSHYDTIEFATGNRDQRPVRVCCSTLVRRGNYRHLQSGEAATCLCCASRRSAVVRCFRRLPVCRRLGRMPRCDLRRSQSRQSEAGRHCQAQRPGRRPMRGERNPLCGVRTSSTGSERTRWKTHDTETATGWIFSTSPTRPSRNAYPASSLPGGITTAGRIRGV